MRLKKKALCCSREVIICKREAHLFSSVDVEQNKQNGNCAEFLQKEEQRMSLLAV
jgi:hypothetical protein